MAEAVDFARVRVRCLGRNTPGVSGFTNRKEQMAAHLQHGVLDDQAQKIGTTWVWVYEDSVELGCVSLAMHSLEKTSKVTPVMQTRKDSRIAQFRPY